MATDIPHIIKASLDALNAHDLDKAVSFYSDDCTYEDVAIGKISHGKDELKAFLQGGLVWAPDARIELKSVFSAGDWAASEWVFTGTHTSDTPQLPATGKRASLRGASIHQLHNGKISRQSDYWNMTSFLQQVGLMPQPPSQA